MGRSLLSVVEQHIGDTYWLYTWKKNEANGFYKHLGFKQIGQIDFEFANELIENYVYVLNQRKVPLLAP